MVTSGEHGNTSPLEFVRTLEQMGRRKNREIKGGGVGADIRHALTVLQYSQHRVVLPYNVVGVWSNNNNNNNNNNKASGAAVDEPGPGDTHN
ncbi:hypothetical protein EYF80_046957 [Liparis tanakae]|uniref:Uncharacterized protein n=1 Tax=Liparis tanakae TaxID=230148 RepID=A0A4Z2FP11_9TELE|nr:hypothetical protein EYF80_046957 [Liparis tanakae]